MPGIKARAQHLKRQNAARKGGSAFAPSARPLAGLQSPAKVKEESERRTRAAVAREVVLRDQLAGVEAALDAGTEQLRDVLDASWKLQEDFQKERASWEREKEMKKAEKEHEEATNASLRAELSRLLESRDYFKARASNLRHERKELQKELTRTERTMEREQEKLALCRLELTASVSAVRAARAASREQERTATVLQSRLSKKTHRLKIARARLRQLKAQKNRWRPKASRLALIDARTKAAGKLTERRHFKPSVRALCFKLVGTTGTQKRVPDTMSALFDFLVELGLVNEDVRWRIPSRRVVRRIVLEHGIVSKIKLGKEIKEADCEFHLQPQKWCIYSPTSVATPSVPA